MVKCQNCGTGWTSSGLPLCPVCGTKVPSAEPVAAPVPAESHPYVIQTAAVQEALRKNGSAVLDVPVEIRKVEPPKAEAYSFPILKRPEPVAEPVVVEIPAPPPPPPAPKTEVRAPDPPTTQDPKPEPFIFQTLKRTEPPPAPAVAVKEKPVENEVIDASAANLPIQALKELRVAARPLNGPLILGCLAYVAVIMLPITMALESHRVVGILGFTLAGFFAPFAPIAWLAGLAAEKRRREQGLRPERQVTLGRLLGQWGTLFLVAQTTVGLIAIAAMRLSSKFPPSFWRGEF